MAAFVSLEARLKGWFGATFAELPEALARTVEREFQPFGWDGLEPDQRRELARQWDCKHDPARQEEHERAWALVSELQELEDQIEAWRAVQTPTASDLQTQQARLAELQAAINRVRARLDRRPPRVPRPSGPAPASGPAAFVAYPSALAHLRHRLKATPEELAAWIFMGPEDGGLVAYLQPGDDERPRRFAFPTGEPSRMGGDHDYVPLMMGCWFARQDIEHFEPKARYITGRDLLVRWGGLPGVDAVAFVRAKVEESRLIDLHPVYGGTRISTDDADYPPVELGLFRVADVEAIEAEDFGGLPGAAGAEGAEERRLRLTKRRAQLRASGVRNFNQVLAEEEGLSVERIKQLLTPKAVPPSPVGPATWVAPIQQKGSPTPRPRKRKD